MQEAYGKIPKAEEKNGGERISADIGTDPDSDPA